MGVVSGVCRGGRGEVRGSGERKERGELGLGRGKKRTYECDYFHEAPEGEEDSQQHGCGCGGATALDGIVVGCSEGRGEVFILPHTVMGAVDVAEKSESDARAEAASLSSCQVSLQ